MALAAGAPYSVDAAHPAIALTPIFVAVRGSPLAAYPSRCNQEGYTIDGERNVPLFVSHVTLM